MSKLINVYLIEFYLIFIYLMFDLTLANVKNHSQIINVNDTKIGDFPAQVSIQLDSIHICGGSIIREDLVLTAAHCFDKRELFKNSSKLEIIACDINRDRNNNSNSEKQIRNVIRVCTHSKYRKNKIFNYDIALLNLNRPLKFTSTCHAMNITKSNSTVGTSCNITGWGQIGGNQSTENTNETTTLKYTGIKIYDPKLCKKWNKKGYGYYFKKSTMICAGSESSDHDNCFGDFGGPLICNNSIEGIISFGKVCGKNEYINGYTRVTAMSKWIDNVLQTGECKSQSEPARILSSFLWILWNFIFVSNQIKLLYSS